MMQNFELRTHSLMKIYKKGFSSCNTDAKTCTSSQVDLEGNASHIFYNLHPDSLP